MRVSIFVAHVTRRQGLWLQDAHCREGDHDTFMPQHETTRGLVTLGTTRGREDCVVADANRTVTLFYRNKACRGGHNAYEEGAPHAPSPFEPRCIVVLLAAESRAALRDEFLAVGRMLVYPLKLNVTYIVATSADPDPVVTSTSCSLGKLLAEAHSADLTGQDARDALVEAQAELLRARQRLQLYERVYLGLPIYLPPASSPPPLAPNGVAPDTLSERLDRYRTDVTAAEELVVKRDAAIGYCQRTRDAPCGRASILAPDPWEGVDPTDPDGEPESCYGATTRETLEGAYCGYWGSPVNVDAADSAVASQLLAPDGAPFCLTCGADDAECADGGAARVLRCPVTAARTNRAGVWELDEWARLDRPYCESDLFKHLVLDNASASEGLCRATLYERVANCKTGICPQCVSPCIYASARVIANVFRCVDGTRHNGFVHYMHTSDAGQLARTMHGAIRKTSYKAVPEKLASHLYHIAHHNPMGYLQRDSVSCRAQNRNSPVARFVPGFGDDGMPMSRDEYMVPCRKDSDCMVCGRHPLTGRFYHCQTRYTLYDTVHTGTRGEMRFLNLSATDAFDIDLQRAAVTNKTGICVDLDSSMNEGCGNDKIAAVKDGIVGCSDAFVGKFLCGLALEIDHGDLSTVRVSGEPFWPRTLIHGAPDADGDGRSVGGVTCVDPIDCVQKCLYLERTSAHGVGAPPTCALYVQTTHHHLMSHKLCVNTFACRPALTGVTSTAATTSCRQSRTWSTPSGRMS